MKRADGTRLRNADVMYRIASHVMAKRSDSMNMITLNIPAAPIQSYLREKSREGTPISHMAVLMGGFVRLMAEFPALNRFIMNKEPYARNELAYGMVVMGAKAGQGKANEGRSSLTVMTISSRSSGRSRNMSAKTVTATTQLKP